VVGRMFDRGEYSATFWLVAGLPCVGVALWRLLTGGRESGFRMRKEGTVGAAQV